jgi:hypothetical protein
VEPRLSLLTLSMIDAAPSCRFYAALGLFWGGAIGYVAGPMDISRTWPTTPTSR